MDDVGIICMHLIDTCSLSEHTSISYILDSPLDIFYPGCLVPQQVASLSYSANNKILTEKEK